MKVIVFDTEATDLQPGQICQLSSLTVENGVVTGQNLYFSVDQMSEEEPSAAVGLRGRRIPLQRRCSTPVHPAA